MVADDLDARRRGERSFDPAVARRFLSFSATCWRGTAGRRVRLITLALAGSLVLKLVADVALNRWNRWFFDALERRDGDSALVAMGAFVVLVAGMAAVGVLIVRTRETLQVHWRAWFTATLLDRWLARDTFHRFGRGEGTVAHPEYRISDDVRMATEPLVDFAIGLFTALLAFVTFIGILWSVGGSYTVPMAGGITIPAFMVVGALIYGVCASALLPVVGSRLAPSAAAKNEAEAHFRAEMIRLRENAETIALAGGEANVRAGLARTYATVVARWLAVVRQHGNVTWVMNANTALIPVVPLVLAAPKYIAGDLSLGQVMQLASAFFQVQIAIGWLADNYWRVAEWFASARRVTELLDGFTAESGRPSPRFLESPDAAVRLADLTLSDRVGRPLVAGASLVLVPGDRIQLEGPAGAGKSVLIRGLAGLWPYGDGSVSHPAGCRISVLTGDAFVPEGRLIEATLYPLMAGERPHEAVARALRRVGLERLVPRLEDDSRWHVTLSTGERQRLAVARVLLQGPDVVVIDEALGAIDDAGQAELVEALSESLPHAVLITVTGRSGPVRAMTRQLTLRPGPGGSQLVEERSDTVAGVRDDHHAGTAPNEDTAALTAETETTARPNRRP